MRIAACRARNAQLCGVDVVLDTLELARLRAVDAALGGSAPATGHWLPALLLARNTGGDPNGDTVATTLPLKPPSNPPGP